MLKKKIHRKRSMSAMFRLSKVRSGYARNAKEAEKLNATSYAPTSNIFTVK